MGSLRPIALGKIPAYNTQGTKLLWQGTFPLLGLTIYIARSESAGSQSVRPSR
jgi:hypothetical protein